MANLVTESMRPVFDYLVSHEIFVGKIERVHADEGLVDAEVMFDWSKIEFLKLQGRAA